MHLLHFCKRSVVYLLVCVRKAPGHSLKIRVAIPPAPFLEAGKLEVDDTLDVSYNPLLSQMFGFALNLTAAPLQLRLQGAQSGPESQLWQSQLLFSGHAPQRLICIGT